MAKELGILLRDVREIHGLSLREAARKSGVSNPYLSQIETGKTPSPSPRVLLKLSNAFNFPYRTFMEVAGYLPDTVEAIPVSDALILLATKDLSAKEMREVSRYIAFVRNQRTR